MKNIANRFFYKVDGQGHPIPGTLARFPKKLKEGIWVEVKKDICCPDAGCPECPSEFKEVAFSADFIGGCNTIFSPASTTIANNDSGFLHYIRFISQDDGTDFLLDIPVEEITPGIFQVDTTVGVLKIPATATGLYKAILYLQESADYPKVTLRNSSNVDIAGGALLSGNIPSTISSTFDIADLDNLLFQGECSG